MRMLVLIYNHLLDDEVQKVLEEADVKSYSEAPKVLGMGEAGMLFDSRHAPGYNSCIFAALPEHQVESLAKAFRMLAELQTKEYGRPCALRVFSLPCEQLV